jgi:glycosyltransferase involved in cell wall biosynthesis
MLLGWRYDTVCVQIFGRRAFPLEALAIWLGRAWRRRVVLVLRGGGLPSCLAQRPQPFRWVYGLADAVVCPSVYMQQEMAHHGLPLLLIPNSIDPARYRFRLRDQVRPRLLWVRTFHPFYNPMLALQTYELVRKCYPEATLTMAGMDRGHSREVQDAAEALALPVQFLGLIPKKDIPSLMDAHDIYLNTPHIDNMPVTVIEALLCGLPVVSTAVGGIPHLLRQEQTGMLVDDGDVQGFVAAITRLVEDPVLGQRLSEHGRRYAENFAWERTLPLWTEVLTPCQPASQAF